MLKFVRSHKMLLVNGCFLCFLFLPLSCFCQEKVKVYKVSAKVDASVKESPAAKSKTVFTIKSGDTAAVLDIKGEWVKIFFRDTMSGWVLKDQVEMTEYVAVIQNEELPTDEIIVLNNNIPANNFAVEDAPIAKTKKTKKQSSSPKKQFSLKEHPYFWYGFSIAAAGVAVGIVYTVYGSLMLDKYKTYENWWNERNSWKEKGYKSKTDYEDAANDHLDEGNKYRNIAIGTGIASGALIITGTVFMIIKKPKNENLKFSFVPADKGFMTSVEYSF